LFNWKIWPDFAEIPNRDNPYLRYESFRLGDTVVLRGRRIRSLPANHVVPAVGFHLDSGEGSLVFTGDTTTNDALWEEVNRIENLRYLIIETAFSNAERALAIASKHLTPDLLAQELAKLARPAKVKIFVSHLKPGEGALTMEEVEAVAGAFGPRMLSNGQVFRF
jgi:ribonuclease BN (tRNA processing enzyme)